MDRLRQCLADVPLVAILRGIAPEQVEACVETLLRAGVRIIEIPLNSSRPYKSLATLARIVGAEGLAGAGTVLSGDEVQAVAETGAQLIVAPNMNPTVIGVAKQNNLITLPGVATPTEAFTALAAGADALKIFPGESLPPAAVKAWRAVLPRETLLLPVGGITPAVIPSYLAAGASGFGIGSALYTPGIALSDLRTRAEAFVSTCRRLV